MASASPERTAALARAQVPAPRPASASLHNLSKRGLGMTRLSGGPSSTMPLAGRPKRSGVIDGSDFLPYPKQAGINHNKQVSVGMGRRLRTTADTAQYEGARRLRIQHSPRSEEERGVRSASGGRLYWVGQKGFERFMQLTHWSEGAPRRRGREESGVYWTEALTASSPVRRSRMCSRHLVATPRLVATPSAR
jgi:hypothetical protein